MNPTAAKFVMRRTFGLVVLECPRWRPFVVVALIEDARIVERILSHAGLLTDRPTPRPPRAPPSEIQRDGPAMA